MSKTSPRGILKRHLEKTLVPAIFDLGFIGPPKLSGNSLNYDYLRSETEHLIINFDKYQRPRFVLDFCRLTKDDSIYWIFGRLQPRSGAFTSSWFRTDSTFLYKFFGSRTFRSPEFVALEATRLLEEIHIWFSTGAIGTHIRPPSAHAAKSAEQGAAANP